MKKKFLKVVAAAATLAVAGVIAVGCSGGSQGASSSASSAAGAQDASSVASSSASSASDAPAADIDTLVVGFDNSYPPYGYIGKDGEYTGLDLDLAAEVASRNGWEIELKPIDWDSKDAELGSGNINCIWNGFTMEGREDDYTFSEPYMLNEQVIVVKADSGIEDQKGLKDKVVITQAGSAADELLEGEDAEYADLAKTFSRLDTIADYNNAFMQLESGSVDAVACDSSIAAYQMAANPDAYVQLEEPLSSEHYAVGFKKGEDALAEVVSNTLKEMYADGAVDTILEKYADDGVSKDNWLLK